MTIKEEQDFLRTWEAKANEGGVLSVPPIHAALVERLGRFIPMSTTYRLLASNREALKSLTYWPWISAILKAN